MKDSPLKRIKAQRRADVAEDVRANPDTSLTDAFAAFEWQVAPSQNKGTAKEKEAGE